MSAKGKEYELAIRISGVIDKNFNTALVSANSQLKGFKATVSAMDKDFTKLDKGFNKIVSTGQKCFTAIATAAGVATLAIGATTAAAIAVGTEFETAFAGVKKTIEATEEEYAVLRQDIRDMSKEIPSTSVEIAGVMEIAGQLGIAKDSLTDFTEVMINLGVSTNMVAEDAATALAKFANVTNMANYDELGVSNYERLGSVIVDLGNNFATTEQDIVDMATNLAATGDMVGLSQAQIMALATAMSATGIKAEKGGTAMSKLLRKIQLAIETGSDSLEQYAKVADMTSEQFSQTFEEDAVVALSAFIDGLNDTERNGMSAIAVLDEMGLSEVRLSDVILRLANSEGIMSNAIDMANTAWEENIALQTEANKRYETAESQLRILGNSIKDLGITAYDELREPFVGTISTITEKVNELNEDLGGANGISKWIKNVGTTLPTLQRKVKTTWKAVEPFFNGLIDVGEWFLDNPDVLVGAIAGIGTALATYKIASTLVHIVNAIMSLATMNPATLVILGIVAALGALVGAITAYKVHEQELIDDSLADHFGDIALSMEEIQAVAQHIVSSESLGGVKEALEAFEDLDGISATMEDAVSELNKLNWKVSIGMELTPDEQETYKQTVADYVTAAQDYVLQAQYAVSINLDLAYSDSDLENQNVVDKVNQFYADKYTQLSELGTKLNNAVTDAFNDGLLDIEETAVIAEIQAEMAAIQEALATGEFDAQLSILSMEFDGGANLTADSFQNLQEELATQVAEATQAYKESYAQNYASIQAAYDAGDYLTDEEYENALTELQKTYLQNVGDIKMKALNFQLETIMSAYAEELDPAIDEYLSGIQDALDKVDSYEWDEESFDDSWSSFYGALYDAENAEVLDKETRGAVQELLDAMAPTMEDIEELKQQYNELGIDMSESMAEGLYNFNLLSVLADNAGKWSTDGISDGIDGSYIVGQLIGQDEAWDSVFDEIFKTAKSSGYVVMYDYIKQGAADAAAGLAAEEIAAAEETIRPVVEGMYAWSQEAIDEYYSKGFTAEADVNITLNPLYRYGFGNFPGYNSLFNGLNINQRADGGLATKPELTWFAEKGPEMAIPIDGSQNAISLWEQTGRLLGMDSVLDGVSVEDSGSVVIEYSPTLQFYGEAPSKDDLQEALSVSQDEFDSLMERYIKTHGRVSFA